MASSDDRVNLEKVTEADFSDRLGQDFRIHLPSGELLRVALVEVTAHPYLPPAPGRRAGFSIVLRSEVSGHLPQAIYRVEHPQMGFMDLFLVPVGPRDGGMCYEAVFN
jgi:hypothetical protein